MHTSSVSASLRQGITTEISGGCSVATEDTDTVTLRLRASHGRRIIQRMKDYLTRAHAGVRIVPASGTLAGFEESSK
jgi:hypothetical protein